MIARVTLPFRMRRLVPPFLLWYTSLMISEAFIEKLLAIEVNMARLELENRQLNRDLNAVKQFLRMAARYQNEDTRNLVLGIQAALGKAAESKGREQRDRKRKGR